MKQFRSVGVIANPHWTIPHLARRIERSPPPIDPLLSKSPHG